MRLSVLDLMVHASDQSVNQTIQRTVESAQFVESLGFHRYWIAEHHNSYHTVASATAVIVQHLLEHTEKIRIGAGGVMMPNHQSLLVAETYGTLYEIYGERIDIGLGRQPHSDEVLTKVLQQKSTYSKDTFTQAIKQLQSYLQIPTKDQKLIAFPGAGSNLPLYILSSSTVSAYVAAKLGLPYAFGSHIANPLMAKALEIYRKNFEPSSQCPEPYVIISVLVDVPYEQSEPNESSLHTLARLTNNRNHPLSSFERALLDTFHGLRLPLLEDSLEQALTQIQNDSQADELILISLTPDQNQTHRAFQVVKQALDSI